MHRTALAGTLTLLTLTAMACGSPPEVVAPPPSPVASAPPSMPPAQPGPRPVDVTLESVGSAHRAGEAA